MSTRALGPRRRRLGARRVDRGDSLSRRQARGLAGDRASRRPRARAQPPVVPRARPRAAKRGDPEAYPGHVLHTEPDGSFSIVALVWRPGQATAIHDHVTWCVFTVVQGVEYEELFTLDEENGTLVEVGSSTNETGSVRLRAAGGHPPRPQRRARDGDLDPCLRHRRRPHRVERAAVLRPSRSRPACAQLGLPAIAQAATT